MNKLFRFNVYRQLIHFLLLTIFSLVAYEASAQNAKTPLLERVITVSITQERLDVALKKISAQAGFTFSYNPSAIESDKIVSYSFTNKTVREVLDQLFKGTIQYKERSKYIILTRAEISSSKKEPQILTGYVVDEATGERLKNVSVYDPVSLSSTVTDSYGYFQLDIKKPTGDEVKLAVNRINYTDTVVVVPQGSGRLLRIPLNINKEKFSTLTDSLGQKLKRFWLNTKHLTEQAINMENIGDSLHRATQVSLVPFVGSNGKLSGNVINDYSFNLLGGYSLGVQKFELGGLFNVVGGNVSGVQIGGLMNTVLGERRGFQLGGLFNATRGDSHGAQLAGLINFNWQKSTDFAGAGLLNFSKGESTGTRFAGLANFALRGQRGFNFAGLFNLSIKDSGPAQVAGLFNFTAGSMTGVQFGGLFNFAAKEMKGAQVAGLINIAPKSVTGAQVSGLINYATRIKGTQVGFINISDSISGIPVGFLSFVVKGYHKLEVSADEIFYTNIAFRTGVRQFYNIITAGAKPETFGDNATLWTFGYGVGTAPRLNRKLFLNIDLTSNQIIKGNTWDEINMLNKLYVGIDFQTKKHLSFIAGLTLNGYVTDTTFKEYPELFTSYKPNFISDKTFSNDLNMKMWVGAKIGVRFF